MILLDESIYKNLARKLMRSIGSGEFFNGTVQVRGGEHCDLTFRATLLIYRTPASVDPSGAPGGRDVANVVPVWWECATVDDSGPAINDFCWESLRQELVDSAANHSE